MAELIGFDGLDGSGKTTLAEGLAKELDMTYLYFSDGNLLKGLREQADNMSVEERFAFYLSMNLMNHPRLKTFKETSTKAIIIDRTPLSTFAYHEVMGIDVSPYSEVKKHLLSNFNAICYVYASVDTRKARIISRLEKEGQMHKFDEFSLQFEEEIHKAFMHAMPNHSILIDTTNLDINSAVNQTKYNLNTNRFFKYE